MSDAVEGEYYVTLRTGRITVYVAADAQKFKGAKATDSLPDMPKLRLVTKKEYATAYSFDDMNLVMRRVQAAYPRFDVGFVMVTPEEKQACNENQSKTLKEQEEKKSMGLLFDKKDVITFLNADKAYDYIDEKGYFGDNYDEISAHIKADDALVLTEVNTTDDTDINRVFSSGTLVYGMFLPADKVIKKEEKWRPYTANEITHETMFLTNTYAIMQIRRKDDPDEIRTGKTTEIRSKTNSIGIGTELYNLQDLFDNWEVFDSSKCAYRPFGKKVDDE